jgi:hypothetical protein
MGVAMNTVILAVVVVFALPVHGQTPDSYSQKILLKNWALSRCLGQVYSDAKAKEDAYATASAYLEFGHQSIEAYDALTTVVNKYATAKFSGSVSSEFNTMKCIDLFNSNELDDLASKFSNPK